MQDPLHLLSPSPLRELVKEVVCVTSRGIVVRTTSRLVWCGAVPREEEPPPTAPRVGYIHIVYWIWARKPSSFTHRPRRWRAAWPLSRSSVVPFPSTSCLASPDTSCLSRADAVQALILDLDRLRTNGAVWPGSEAGRVSRRKNGTVETTPYLGEYLRNAITQRLDTTCSCATLVVCDRGLLQQQVSQS